VNAEEKRKLVDSYKLWWHSIDFGDGVWSDGVKENTEPVEKRMLEEKERWAFPEDYFKGKKVLDIGSWDGYFAFHAEKKGALSVAALDDNAWTGKSWSTKEGFDIARKLLGSNVQEIIMDILDATPEKIGTFDVILFAGVLYHLQNPYMSLSVIHSLLNKGGSLFVETSSTEHLEDVPIMVFHPKDSCGGDCSNYWSPNSLCLQKMLEEVGFVVDDIFSVAESNDELQTRVACYCHKD
jgi:tRNA (mo5U34)-methyltransferase